jgi:hypothetical protein
MIRLRLAPLVLVAALAGCDDTTVTNVGRRTFLTAPELAEKLGEDALLVEIHGLPWAGADPAEVVGTLRMPEGKARGIRFQEIPAGEGYLGGGERLVLRFNPPAGANIQEDCRATEPLPVRAPQEGGFEVNASYCQGTDWLIHAHFEARVEPEDWLAYYLAMEELLGTMFRAK